MKNFRLSIIELIGKIFDYRSINRSKANTSLNPGFGGFAQTLRGYNSEAL